MGYTHYWKFRAVPKGQAKQVEETYQLAIRQCQKIIRSYNKSVKEIDIKHPDRLSGYSAHTKVNDYGGLNFNGTQDLSHEDFTMREHFNQNEGFNFCKTAEKPYDIVVVACLITMKHYLGDLIDVSSDGRDHEWTEGLELAQKVLKIKDLTNPIESPKVLKLVGR